MDSHVSDQGIRSLLHRNSPAFTSDEIWVGVQKRIASRTRAPRSRRRLIRVFAMATAGVVLAGGVSYGVFEAVNYLSKPGDILVISDDRPISPNAGAGVTIGAADYQIDLGPADQIKFAEAWRQIAELLGVDTNAWTDDYSLDFTSSGDFVAMSITIPLPGQKILVSWDGRDGARDQEVLATVSTTEIPGHDSYSTDYGLSYRLAKVDEVGVAQILAVLPQAGAGVSYRIGQWEPDDELSPGGEDSYVWAGASFEPFAQWGGPTVASISWVTIEGMTLTPEPSGTVQLWFMMDSGISLPNSTVTTEPAAEFAELMDAWATRMIIPVGVGHDYSEPNGIYVKLSAEALAPPDGIMVSALLVREAFLAVHEHDLPFDMLALYSVDADRTETLRSVISLQSGIRLADGWELEVPLGAGPDSSEVYDVASGRAYVLTGTVGGDGSTLKVHLQLPEEDAQEAYAGYLKQLIAVLKQFNREGGRIALLQLSIDDAGGNPVLRDVHDFQLGSISTWYSGEEYRPPWINPPASFPRP